MRNILILLSFLSCIYITYGQEPNRAVEGGGSIVTIDSITPLSVLIERLKYPLQFVETGKMYWIGYPNLMFSIAYHKDKAIQPLVDFINRVHSIEAKENALYTLHLIGLESSTGGRFSEEFKNPKARKAILQFMNHYALHRTVVHLLMRDPWRMDISYYMEYLSKPNKDYSKVLHALNWFYLLKNRPLCQQIPAYLRKINIRVKYPREGQCLYFADITALKRALGNKLYVDYELTNSKDWKDCVKQIQEGSTNSGTSIASALLFNLGGMASFTDFDSEYFYACDKKKISIYGLSGAKRVWLEWWKIYKHKRLRWEATPGFHKNG
jgi:hypothetical protein